MERKTLAGGHDPGGKLTLYDVFAITTAICSGFLGWQWGYRVWGWPTAILAAATAFYLGGAVGRIPMLSPSLEKRWHGWRTLNLCFPEAAAALENINPRKPTDEDVERIRTLLSSGPQR